LLETDGKGEGEETLIELAGVIGFGSRSYFTNERRNLLDFDQALPFASQRGSRKKDSRFARQEGVLASYACLGIIWK